MTLSIQNYLEYLPLLGHTFKDFKAEVRKEQNQLLILVFPSIEKYKNN